MTSMMTPELLRARVLYRDAHLIVLDKPAGVAVHAGPRTPQAVEAWLDWLRFGFARLPGFAHRLDADTSGCLVLGRHPKALRRLGELFAAGAIERVYWAIVTGHPSDDAGRIDRPLLKATAKPGWRVRVDAKGQSAITDYRVLGRDGASTWLELRPRTGRTHQLRVHCADAGMPIQGDALYGRARAGAAFLLHAVRLEIPYDARRPAIVVEAPVPDAMRHAIARMGTSDAAAARPPGKRRRKAG
jgi:RluA family pseudouridine synthase